MLRIDSVSAGYGTTEILHSISLDFSQPGIYVVLGPNGAGKTTLFRTVAGVIKPVVGTITLDSADLYSSNEVRREIGYLSHVSALPEEMTVRDSLKFYAEIEDGSVDRAIDALELRDLATKKINSLSQGQKKRVSIAKLFLRERKLYLMDEPTSNLDPVVAKEVRDIVLRLSKDRFVLYSSHNLYEAQEIGDYIVLIKDGAIGFFGKKDELRTGEYRIGVKTSGDPSKLFPQGRYEKEYYVMSVSGRERVSEIVKGLVSAGLKVYEVKEMGNPLEELFGIGVEQ